MLTLYFMKRVSEIGDHIMVLKYPDKGEIVEGLNNISYRNVIKLWCVKMSFVDVL